MSVIDATMSLSQIGKNRTGRIIALGSMATSNMNDAMVARLRDMGFEEECIVELMHEGPLGKDPLAVRVEGTTIALRRAEAELIKIKIEE